MTEPKSLPSNLKDLKGTASFKEVWEKHNISDLNTLLADMNVETATTDNKTELVWRYMDAKGMAFGEVEPEQTQPEQAATVADDEQPVATAEQTATVAGDEPVKPEPVPHALPSNLEALAGTDTFKEVWDSHNINELIVILDDMGVLHASTDNKTELVWRYMSAKGMIFGNNNVDATQPPKQPNQQPNQSDMTFAGYLQQALHQNSIKISVTNNSPYDVYETVTRTTIGAKKTTTLHITPAQQDSVTANLQQINRNRGGILDIEIGSK